MLYNVLLLPIWRSKRSSTKNWEDLSERGSFRNRSVNKSNSAADPLNAYPALWAPFVIVGEGAVR